MTKELDSRAFDPRPPFRRDRLLQAIAARKLDALLVSDPIHVSYLTGFRGEDSHLFLSPRKALLLTDSRFEEQWALDCPGLDALVRRTGQTMLELESRLLARHAGKRIGFEAAHLSVEAWRSLSDKTRTVRLVPTAGLVEKLRAVKDEGEVEEIRGAVRMAERGFDAFRRKLREGKTEKELADLLDAELRRAGARSSAFGPIVAGGARAALPHAIAGASPYRAEEMLLVDWGARGESYHSDLTRVLAPRTISPKFRRIYTLVQEAQRRAIASIRPGETGRRVDAVARGHIARAGYGDAFGHGLGHGLGRAVHEAPGLRRNSSDVLEPGMVVTVEPGVYLPGWGGIRIEDDVLVTADGAEVLSTLPTDLDELVVDP